MAYSFPLSAHPAFFSEQHAFAGVTAAVAVDFSLLSQDFPSDFPSEQHDFFAGTIAVADNAIDLGASGVRFKDAYLSGGVYLGGTGSANKLDDYEEGTFTPVMEGSTTNPGYGGGEAGRYTKIGNIVHFSAYVDMNPYNSNGNGNIYFAGLPFTVDGSNAGATRNISLSIWGPTIGSGYSISGQPVNNSNYLQFALWGDNRNQVVWTYSTASFSSGDAIYIQGHYFTNS